MALRDDILDKVFAKKQFKTKDFEYNGITLEIRQLSVEGKSKISEKTIKYEMINGVPQMGSLNILETQIWTVLLSTYIKGTDQLLFNPEVHYEKLKNLPADDLVEKIYEIASNLNNERTIEEIKKQ